MIIMGRIARTRILEFQLNLSEYIVDDVGVASCRQQQPMKNPSNCQRFNLINFCQMRRRKKMS